MSETSSITIGSAHVSGSTGRALWLPGVGYAVAGAAAAYLAAVVAHALGASLEGDGKPIPATGFATLALFFSLLGVLLAGACRRWSRQPARLFLKVTVALLVLSVIPDLVTPGFDTATRLALICSHLAVAAVVIPGLRSRLG